MLRTKDFFVIIIACVLAAMLIGLFLPSPKPYPETVVPSTEPLMSGPYRDSYAVFLSTPPSHNNERDAFIDKIRLEYAPQVPSRKVEISSPEASALPSIEEKVGGTVTETSSSSPATMAY